MKNYNKKKIINSLNNYNSITEVLKKNACDFPNKDFIIDHTSNDLIKVSYSDFDLHVNNCCKYFKDLKIKKGDIISLLLDNSLTFLIIYFASIRYGSILNPLPTTLGNKIILEKLQEVNPKVIFKHADIKFNNKNFNNKIINIKTFKSFNLNLLKTKTKKIKFKEEKKEDIVLLYYSSGTTGKSKIISYSNKAILENQKAVISTKIYCKNNIHLCFLPLYHTASLRYSIKFNLCVGGTVILYKNFWSLKNSIWKIIENYKVNYFQTVPTILNVILNSRYDNYKRPKSIKYIGSGSAILPWQMLQKFEKKFKIKISNLYGLSEIGCSHFDDPFKKIKKPGEIGNIVPGFKYKIFKEKDLSDYNFGELGVKSKTLLSNYYKNNSLFKKSFKEGFFLTGDIVSIDSKNNFFYIDRKKDLIIKGGVNILPSEIERVLQNLPYIKDVAVTSIFDEFYGENICCCLVLHKNKKFNLEKIDNYCLKHLGSFKKPDKYHVLKQLPKGPSGKVLKIELKKIYEKK